MESGWKPNVEISPNCPRCGSSNTKFCYYNNYSLTQPRYFCKGCRRYWTKGGSLRNVPVGGGCRKNRRGNKTLLRSQSNIDGLTFRNSPNCDNSGATTTIDNPIWHSCDVLPRRTANSSSSPSSSDGPNIDLALVYANFLNQKPHPGEGVGLDHDNHLDQIQTAFDPNSIEKSRLISNTEVVGPSTLPAEELGLTGCLNIITQQQPSTEVIEPHFVDEGNNNQLYCSEFHNSLQTLQKDRSEGQCGNHDGMNFELPPLPGEEEEASHDHLMWSNSGIMMINHPFHQVTQQQPLLGPQADDDDADLLIGNWSPFDLPTRDASFSRP